jgi:dienelactone hydrolase
MNPSNASVLLTFVIALVPFTGRPAESRMRRQSEMLTNYFRTETTALADRSLSEIKTAEDWNAKKERYREQLMEMLGLLPLPEKTDLKPVITGHVEHPEFRVENLHFQSLPGLYVTGNLYLPRKIDKPLPAILYVCGHGRVAKDGVSYGNKVAYQHHGAWFARNGYVCLIIDTIQLGELEGLHHGTYREGMWWWNARGYTPAGVEAWNGIRALDYLQSRPEVNAERLGVTGRSGGGAYSWWITALDDRIKAAAPVAGITDLRNHIVDGCVEGHCDCMFVVNTYRWDYAQVAALVAPRPLLIANSDKDSIFPLDGVSRIHEQVRRIYRMHNAGDRLGLLITEGPHKDTQDLQLPVFRWFNRFLKDEDPVIETAAVKFFEPEQLKVFTSLPSTERTTKIHETFVPAATLPPIPKSVSEWGRQREQWLTALQEKCFHGWPDTAGDLQLYPGTTVERKDLKIESVEFESQMNVRLPLFVIRTPGASQVELEVLDDESWNAWAKKSGGMLPVSVGTEFTSLDADAFADLKARRVTKLLFAPRGIGPAAWEGPEKKQVQIRRRFMLLGQTVDSMRVWDIRRAIQAAQKLGSGKTRLVLQSGKSMAVNALYAAIFEPGIQQVELTSLPTSHRNGPDYLNVLRILDLPQAVALAADKTPVTLLKADASAWQFPFALGQTIRWPSDRLQIK